MLNLKLISFNFENLREDIPTVADVLANAAGKAPDVLAQELREAGVPVARKILSRILKRNGVGGVKDMLFRVDPSLAEVFKHISQQPDLEKMMNLLLKLVPEFEPQAVNTAADKILSDPDLFMPQLLCLAERRGYCFGEDKYRSFFLKIIMAIGPAAANFVDLRLLERYPRMAIQILEALGATQKLKELIAPVIENAVEITTIAEIFDALPKTVIDEALLDNFHAIYKSALVTGGSVPRFFEEKLIKFGRVAAVLKLLRDQDIPLSSRERLANFNIVPLAANEVSLLLEAVREAGLEQFRRSFFHGLERTSEPAALQFILEEAEKGDPDAKNAAGCLAKNPTGRAVNCLINIFFGDGHNKTYRGFLIPLVGKAELNVIPSLVNRALDGTAVDLETIVNIVKIITRGRSREINEEAIKALTRILYQYDSIGDFDQKSGGRTISNLIGHIINALDVFDGGIDSLNNMFRDKTLSNRTRDRAFSALSSIFSHTLLDGNLKEIDHFRRIVKAAKYYFDGLSIVDVEFFSDDLGRSEFERLARYLIKMEKRGGEWQRLSKKGLEAINEALSFLNETKKQIQDPTLIEKIGEISRKFIIALAKAAKK